MEKIKNLKSHAKAICLALSTIDHPEFTHLNQLARVKEVDYVRGTLVAVVKLNVSPEWANLFHSISLVVRFGCDEDEDIVGGTVNYSYEHPCGGENGHDLCRFSLTAG